MLYGYLKTRVGEVGAVTPDVKMGEMYKRTIELKFENYHLSNNVI